MDRKSSFCIVGVAYYFGYLLHGKEYMSLLHFLEEKKRKKRMYDLLIGYV